MTAAPTGTPAPPLLRLRDVTKTFGAVVALRSGSIDLHAGSIHALIGENGAGKSTLVKIIAGLHRRDTGDVLLDGQSVDFTSTAQSKAAGIAVIYQEPTLFPDLSVVENIFMGRQPTGALGRIDRKAMREEAERIFDRLGVNIDPDRITDGLSIADQQLIEIAKAISLDARVLIMDEPKAALSGVEVDRLFQVARSLRDEGRALMFISHRFDEIFDLCDTVTVMRDGAYIATTPIADTSVEELVRQMVGRDVDEPGRRACRHRGRRGASTPPIAWRPRSRRGRRARPRRRRSRTRPRGARCPGGRASSSGGRRPRSPPASRARRGCAGRGTRPAARGGRGW